MNSTTPARRWPPGHALPSLEQAARLQAGRLARQFGAATCARAAKVYDARGLIGPAARWHLASLMAEADGRPGVAE